VQNEQSPSYTKVGFMIPLSQVTRRSLAR
jgi:hypothetical protein